MRRSPAIVVPALLATLPLTGRLTLTGLADIGGFGAGSGFTAQVFTGLALRLTGRGAAEAGFRYLHFDREASRADFDADLWGPTVGLAIAF